MNVEVVNEIEAAKTVSGTALVALICRVTVDKGQVTLLIGDHTHYRAEATENGGVMLRNIGSAPKAKTVRKK